MHATISPETIFSDLQTLAEEQSWTLQDVLFLVSCFLFESHKGSYSGTVSEFLTDVALSKLRIPFSSKITETEVGTYLATVLLEAPGKEHATWWLERSGMGSRDTANATNSKSRTLFSLVFPDKFVACFDVVYDQNPPAILPLLRNQNGQIVDTLPRRNIPTGEYLFECGLQQYRALVDYKPT